MRKLWIAVLVVVVLAVAGLLVLRRPSEPQDQTHGQASGDQGRMTETVVFDLHYRALTGREDPLSYHSYWGWGSDEPTDNPFVEAVKKQVQESKVVYNGAFPKTQQWSVVELKEKKPVAMYFDLNADGKLTDDERIVPLAASQSQQQPTEFAFITPDFTIRRDGGEEILFRAMLVADSYGDEQVTYMWMWSPCCVLEGQANFGGEPMRLFLYDGGFDGAFNVFGSSSFVLVPASQKLSLDEYLPRSTLSSLICRDGAYYKVSLDGSCEKGKTLQFKIQKDTSPTGKTVLSLKGKEPLKTRLNNARISGAADNTIQFDTANAQSVIPVGKYKLAWGSLCYGVETDDQWQVSLNAGPEFTIVKDETASIEIGEPALIVKAVSEQERSNSEVKPKTTFAKGTPLYLSLEIKGKAGEAYTRFSKKNADNNQWTDVKAHLTIVNADGKEITPTDLEYG